MTRSRGLTLAHITTLLTIKRPPSLISKIRLKRSLRSQNLNWTLTNTTWGHRKTISKYFFRAPTVNSNVTTLATLTVRSRAKTVLASQARSTIKESEAALYVRYPTSKSWSTRNWTTTTWSTRNEMTSSCSTTSDQARSQPKLRTLTHLTSKATRMRAMGARSSPESKTKW